MKILLYIIALLAFLAAIAIAVFISLCLFADWKREDGGGKDE